MGTGIDNIYFRRTVKNIQLSSNTCTGTYNHREKSGKGLSWTNNVQEFLAMRQSKVIQMKSSQEHPVMISKLINCKQPGKILQPKLFHSMR